LKTEQELTERYKQIIKELLIDTDKNKHGKWHRRMLLKEYNVLHWVLFE
jgi:hypothetical protein